VTGFERIGIAKAFMDLPFSVLLYEVLFFGGYGDGGVIRSI